MALKKKVRGNVKPVSRVNKNIATDNKRPFKDIIII